MEWLKVLILGLVEGVTEFLPISSTGHLIVASDLLKFNSGSGETFNIFIQIGAVVAVILYYRRELISQAKSFPSNTNTRQLWLGIIIAFIPAATIGFLFSDWIMSILDTPVIVAFGLIIGGFMFLIVEYFMKTSSQENSIDETPLTLKQAFIVGLWQVLALIPGMSRSGMSIMGGLVSGLDRKRATQFSFYLAIPTLGIATLYSLYKSINVISFDGFVFLIVGAIISGIVAWFAIDWLLRYVTRNNFIAFGYYRIVIGIIILLMLRY